MLLKRYGIVFRDVLARETNLPKWRELQMAFRRLEDRGEIRGGRFVDGFLGEQFALPVAVESLRAYRKLPGNANAERIVIAAADPLNLVGIIVPGERIPAISGKSVTFRDGVWDAEDALQLASNYYLRARNTDSCAQGKCSFSSNCGFRYTPCQRTARWRWGPVARPVPPL